MKEKINIAKILKYKPQGTKLYDLLRNIDVELDKVHTTDVGTYIECTSNNEVGSTLMFDYSKLGTEKLERANILAKSLIPKVNELLNMSTKSMRSSLADAIYGLSECDEEFKTKFKQLLNETKQRFQKEFDDL